MKWKQIAISFGIMLAIILALCVVRATIVEADKRKSSQEDWTQSIVYTEGTASETTTEQTEYPEDPLAPYYELTTDEREWIATLVAGKAVDQSAGCQQAVATVILNEIIDCQEDIGRAVRKYTLYDAQMPTETTYEAVDAVFERGEELLDDDVLWFGDADHPSEFHKGLVYVCEIDGIAFYKAPRPAVVSGGAAE